jgi:hypothetical protein
MTSRIVCLPVVALGSGRPAIKRIVLCPGDGLFNESEIVVKQFLGSCAGSNRASAIHRRHDHSAAIKAHAMLVAYWLEIIDQAPVHGSAIVSSSLLVPERVY